MHINEALDHVNDFIIGKKNHTPDHFGPLDEESFVIMEDLLKFNRRDILTLNSQPFYDGQGILEVGNTIVQTPYVEGVCYKDKRDLVHKMSKRYVQYSACECAEGTRLGCQGTTNYRRRITVYSFKTKRIQNIFGRQAHMDLFAADKVVPIITAILETPIVRIVFISSTNITRVAVDGPKCVAAHDTLAAALRGLA